MGVNKTSFLSVIFLCIFTLSCSAQNKESNDKTQEKSPAKCINRKPAAAGRFYTSDPAELVFTLKEIFERAEMKKTNNVIAIISPHAGYAFSGEVAASSFNQIERDKNYKNIFIIASSHYTSFKGASVYNLGNYETPLGEVEVNIPLATKLINEHPVFTYYSAAHKEEHSLENQLPLLQYVMETDYQIVPIVIGSQSIDVSEKIAKALKPYFTPENLFIISTDFSHYPTYEDAKLVDKLTADAICLNSPDDLVNTLIKNEGKNISNLATSLCGWTSVLTLLYMTENDPDIEIVPIQYKNSGDVSSGDRNRVVGYYSIAVRKKNSRNEISGGFDLDQEEKVKLLEIARETITTYLKKGTIPSIDQKVLSDKLIEQCGAFVTLNKNHNLRGCIGRFTADIPLYQVVQEMAIAAATQDRRFPKVTSHEIEQIDIEISVLTPLKKIESINDIEMGKHGIYIKKGYHTGTFLPQVAEETGWTKEEFLGHCSRDKAGLGWDGWRDAELYTYEALVFSEDEMGE